MIRGRGLVPVYCCLALGAVACATSAWAIMVPLSLEQVTQRADHIVVGEVVAISDGYRADWPGVGMLVFTDVGVEVEEEWKGALEGHRLTLQVPGGRLPDGSKVFVSDAPRFRLGEKVLVFSYTHLGRPWVYGWEQGKYTMVRKRVVGKADHPIAEDVLSEPLRRRIEQMLAGKR